MQCTIRQKKKKEGFSVSESDARLEALHCGLYFQGGTMSIIAMNDKTPIMLFNKCLHENLSIYDVF